MQKHRTMKFLQLVWTHSVVDVSTHDECTKALVSKLRCLNDMPVFSSKAATLLSRTVIPNYWYCTNMHNTDTYLDDLRFFHKVPVTIGVFFLQVTRERNKLWPLNLFHNKKNFDILSMGEQDLPSTLQIFPVIRKISHYRVFSITASSPFQGISSEHTLDPLPPTLHLGTLLLAMPPHSCQGCEKHWLQWTPLSSSAAWNRPSWSSQPAWSGDCSWQGAVFCVSVYPHHS